MLKCSRERKKFVLHGENRKIFVLRKFCDPQNCGLHTAPSGGSPSQRLVFGWSSVLFLRSVFNPRNRSQICFGDPNRCNINLQEENGVTPLYMTAQSGHASVTEQLIEACCNVDLQMNDGATPLYAAAGSGHAAVTEQFLVARCNVDLPKAEPRLSVQNGMTQTPSSSLLRAVTSICRKAFNGHAAVTKQLIAARL